MGIFNRSSTEDDSDDGDWPGKWEPAEKSDTEED